MGKYEEEVYSRAEHQFRSVEAQIGWLASFEEKTGAYANDAVNVAGYLQNSIDIEKSINSTSEYDNLEALKKDVNKLPSYIQTDLLGEIETKQEKIVEELAKLTEQRKEERIKLESEEKQKERIESRRADIQRDLERASSLGDIRKVQRRIYTLRDEVDVSDLESQAEGMSTSYEEQQITGELRRQAKQTQRAKIEETGEGAHPDF